MTQQNGSGGWPKWHGAVDTLLELDDLTVDLTREGRFLRVVDRVSFSVQPGEVVGLVGESGSGKTVTGLAITGLLPDAARVGGRVLLQGVDLLGLSETERRRVRGSEIAMVFQESTAALNPVFSIGSQVSAVLRAQQGLRGGRAHEEAVRLMSQVGLRSPEAVLKSYPHQLSGGMCQRVMIGMALACQPRLLIADEPTTSLDVTIQAEIIELLRSLAQSAHFSVLFISHDLGLVAELCNRVVVMYAGQVVEQGPLDVVLHTPRQPYTEDLLSCAADLEHVGVVRRGIPGSPPAPGKYPTGCRFAPRCRHVLERCRLEEQVLEGETQSHLARCWRTAPVARPATKS